MGKRFLHNRAAVVTVAFVLLIALIGILAPLLAPHDPYVTDILNKFAPYSLEYPLGTDHLGRCVLSRLIYGIRPTLGLALLTMLGTIALGALLGVMAGYFRGVVEEVIMRVVDVMLSFPSQIMVFAVVGLLGINVQNVIIANVFIKWAWYARMIRTGVMQYRDRNFVQFSRCVGMPERFILFRHLLPSITSDLAVLASLDVGWAIINISTLSFLGLGVQAPTPEWGAMLNEAKDVLTSNPTQMIAPGIAIVVLVCCFTLTDSHGLRDPQRVRVDTVSGNLPSAPAPVIIIVIGVNLGSDPPIDGQIRHFNPAIVNLNFPQGFLWGGRSKSGGWQEPHDRKESQEHRNQSFFHERPP